MSKRNNGRVGTLGIFLWRFLTTRALVDPHPALKAASPQATCADMFIGDDWHHNGAFRWITLSAGLQEWSRSDSRVEV